MSPLEKEGAKKVLISRLKACCLEAKKDLGLKKCNSPLTATIRSIIDGFDSLGVGSDERRNIIISVLGTDTANYLSSIAEDARHSEYNLGMACGR